MQLSNWVLIGAIETYAVLVIVCIFLLSHARGLKTLINRLQDKITGLVSDLANAKQQFKDAQQSSNTEGSYSDQLEIQIDKNREYHQSLSADRDIALDLDNATPLERKIAALRHAVLIAEKEASLAGDQDSPNWKIIQSKFGGFLEFFSQSSATTNDIQSLEHDGDAMEGLQQALSDSYQRIENLEKFQQLFFDMEDKWEETKQQADDYFQQLQQLSVSDEAKPQFDALLNNYRAVYDDLDEHFQQASKKQGNVELAVETPAPAKSDAELAKLRSVAANQHQLINELQRRLESANSAEERIELIDDLQKQLEQQKRFVTESEMCIGLMDSELQNANERIQQLARNARKTEAGASRVKSLEASVEKNAMECLKMKRMIDKLQQENDQLAQQAMSTTSPADSQALKNKLQQLQQRYLGLEEKYLKLRTQR